MDCNLKFRYFLIFILFMACGDSSNGVKKNKVSDNSETENETKTTNKTILFYGDSLTAGFGLDDIDDAFPALIQTTIDSLQLNYTVINSGVSGETTSGGRNRLNWVLNQTVDIFVLELGANDGLRGIPLNETRENLQAMINMVKEKNPETKIVLAGMQIPPNMGQDYTTEFRNIFPELAQKNEAHLIPFLLKDVGGIPELNQGDGIHPTIEGQKIVANNVWDVLRDIVQ
ncbi:arylesterase [Winogradskyella immobilis]|uniref:Arylesterase n=1 Tax=Winogradskyella immobilis TaxID=2816852 RepID=A0ABS8ET97_9FLAO|nr:arylesterase [Winogradskyella immobilis]MCC1485502.1 arylesterase [Winogradskyella immobilis]MCG0017594.1 arylesterase [Winogradskyella immobilis]